MPRSYAPQFRAMVVEQVRSGRSVAEVAADLELCEGTVFRWVRQDRIDRGELEGTSTVESAHTTARHNAIEGCRCPYRLVAERPAAPRTCRSQRRGASQRSKTGLIVSKSGLGASPTLADLKALNTGVMTLVEIADEIATVAKAT